MISARVMQRKDTNGQGLLQIGWSGKVPWRRRNSRSELSDKKCAVRPRIIGRILQAEGRARAKVKIVSGCLRNVFMDGMG